MQLFSNFKFKYGVKNTEKDNGSWLNFPVADSKERIQVIGSLRGYAALAVLICHAGEHLTEFPQIAQALAYGQMGVVLFFVISGIVMPWSLHGTAYQSKDIFRFLAQRSVRIDIPYYVIILLTLLFQWFVTLRPGYSGVSFQLDWVKTLLHLGYLIPFFNEYTWYNNVFWTLGVEFQYYVILGLVFPFFKQSQWVRIFLLIFFALIGFATFSNYGYFILRYQGLFVMGILLYQIFNRNISLATGLVIALVETLLVGFQFHWDAAFTGLFSFLVILRFHQYPLPGAFLGKISYSLYLVHPLTIAFLTAGFRRMPNGPLYNLGYFLITIGVSIALAWVLWRWVEIPALNWSHSLRAYFNRRATETVSEK